MAMVHEVLDTTNISYRDAILIQLAYREQATDLTVRHAGARSVAAKLGTFFESAHIRHVRDAYQNIGKNSSNLVRGNDKAFDGFLVWASSGTSAPGALHALFEYCCAYVAVTARPVDAFPLLDKGKLTFANVTALLNDLFDVGSQGAYEQFSIAALLHALVDQSDIDGMRVETKNLNASDKSSSAAGDIQIFMKGIGLIEAYEVTANNWSTKLEGVINTMKAFDLPRANIIAQVGTNQQLLDAIMQLQALPQDVSVLDLRAFSASLVATLRKNGRGLALQRLYDLLDTYQADTSKTNRYVAMLKSSGLTSA